MNNPKISIIIRTKNEEKYISQCLKKISQQTLKEFEIIIVDNHSSDLTVKKANLFTKKIIKIKKDRFYAGGGNCIVEACTADLRKCPEGEKAFVVATLISRGS